MKAFQVFLAGAAAATLCAVAVPARAADVLFDFENQPIFTETPFSMTVDGVTAAFSGPAAVDPGAFGISSNFQTPTGFQYRLMHGDFLTIGSAFGASGSALTIAFSQPVSGVTFDFALDDPANASTLSFATNAGGAGSTGGALTAGYRYPEGSFAFAGTTPFTSLTLQSTAIDFQLDTLRASLAVAPVPEPTNLLLLAAGLPLLALARRRAKRRDANA